MAEIGIIVGSTRPGRVAEQVAAWVAGRASAGHDVGVDVIDLEEVGLPFLDEPEHPSTGIYTHEHTRRWSQRVARLDAVVLLVPEYNSSFSAPLKNALDFLASEWARKPVAMVGYGMSSRGTRAVAALTPVLVALGMVPAGAVFLPLRERVDESGVLVPTSYDDEGLDALVHDLLDLERLLHPTSRVTAIAS
jgi:NAD(P)H-dependent FMN reductase